MKEVTRMTTNWNYPTTIRFGIGRLNDLADVCRELGIKRPLLISDAGLADLPIAKRALAGIRNGGLAVGLFSDIKPNPTGKNVEEGLAAYRMGNYDGVIAFGGGSALDAAKAVALMAGQTRPLWDFEDVGDNWQRVDPGGIAPLVAVPTTAGTGSEVGRASIIVQEETQTKKIIFHPKMMPQVVVADPETTVGLPPHLTAATGMDALSHCLEAYCAPGYHPMADGIAVEGMRLIFEWLPVAVSQGSNLEARSHMLAAAGMGATAFQKGLGAMHSLAHPIGALYDTQHGLTNAVLMPYVLDFNCSAIEERINRLAARLELPSASFSAFMERVLELRRALAIPQTLRELNIDDSRAKEIATMAAADPTACGNPIPAGAEEMKTIFLHALRGR